jgi:hypothetical protein
MMSFKGIEKFVGAIATFGLGGVLGALGGALGVSAFASSGVASDTTVLLSSFIFRYSFVC